MAATSANGGVVAFNNTPTRSGTAGATTYLQTVTTPNPKFILLATDGLPTCGTGGAMDDAVAAEAAVAAANTAGFKTFVVGIATGGSADTTLSNLANAGGLPRQGTPSYYSVTTAADLAAAIRTLIGVGQHLHLPDRARPDRRRHDRSEDRSTCSATASRSTRDTDPHERLRLHRRDHEFDPGLRAVVRPDHDRRDPRGVGELHLPHPLSGRRTARSQPARDRVDEPADVVGRLVDGQRDAQPAVAAATPPGRPRC